MSKTRVTLVVILAFASLRFAGSTTDKDRCDETNHESASEQGQLHLDLYRQPSMAARWNDLGQLSKGVEKVITGQVPYPFKCAECFKGLGCFDACNGTFSYIHMLPETPEQINTTFRLFPWYDNSSTIFLNYTDVSGLNRTIFANRNRGLLIVNHGFAADSKSDWMVDLKNIVIKYRQYNVILVDWLNGAGPYDFFYPLAVVNTEVVGRQVAVLLHQLFSTYALQPVTVHYVGHSLGAQAAHFFAEYFKNITGGLRIKHITALDAASPLFEAYDIGLNPNDALFVDALHTSAGDSILTGKLGVVHPIGHVDFYLNGGTYQPGCWKINLGCAHTRAHDYYVEAAFNQLSNNSCKFSSHSCSNGLSGYRNGTCYPNVGNFSRISFDATSTMPGNGMQYVETNSSSPFCIA
ncbi:pancreatic lipase-related protein 2-like [Tropilaelaps mercedesae]|uniref:Pancreatic lipase-related protein 2-like n=1 Tax=Tropilaelaps mercedesae TaxID=418985 RepID=A0A1V9Y323_9ACAR|nr:pancreatic lipase-related protein 2-like [Tropilaelaps mercedesae]